MFEALSYGDILRQERALREFNDCHEPDTGRFCAKPQWAKAASRPKRATRLMQKLNAKMRTVGGNIGRAVTLRKRMDVAARPASWYTQNSFSGTLLRRGPWRPKRQR